MITLAANRMYSTASGPLWNASPAKIAPAIQIAPSTM
jgi:hypothetical protein